MINLLFVGIDELLARHVAHLFIRDPLVIFKESLEEQNDENVSDHFEVFYICFHLISFNYQFIDPLKKKLYPEHTINKLANNEI